MLTTQTNSTTTTTCHVCGRSIHRYAIAGHQRRCIRELVGIASSAQTRHVLQHGTSVPCVNCHSHIAAYQFQLHLQTCTGPTHPLPITPFNDIPFNTRSESSMLQPPLPPISPLSSNVANTSRSSPARFDTSANVMDNLRNYVTEISNTRTEEVVVVPQEVYNQGNTDGIINPLDTQGPEMNDDEEFTRIDRVPCSLCGRKFVIESLDRHMSACSKLKSKNRPVFNAQAKRVKGTDLEKFVTVSAPSSSTGTRGSKASALDVKANSMQQLDIPSPGLAPLRKPKLNTAHGAGRMQTARSGIMNMSAMEQDYVPCPACGRKFNKEAAERHIPVCQERQSRLDMNKKHAKTDGSSPGSTGEELLKRRIKYQPPLPGNKNKMANSGNNLAGSQQVPQTKRQLSCSNCGLDYLTVEAKFCFECGTRRQH